MEWLKSKHAYYKSAISIGTPMYLEDLRWIWNTYINNLTALGIYLTFGYTKLMVNILGNDVIGWIQVEVEKGNLNTIGDFLAGLFGPVAFGWLIIGYLMQNQELRNSSNQARKAQQLTANQIDFQIKSENSRKKERKNMARPVLNINIKATEEEKFDISKFSTEKIDYKKNKISFSITLNVFKNDIYDFSLQNQYQMREGFFILPISFPVIKAGEKENIKIDINKDGLKCLIENEEFKIPFSFLDVNGELCKSFLHVIKLDNSIACRIFTRSVEGY